MNTKEIIGEEIRELENFLEPRVITHLVAKIYSYKDLWERRTEKHVPYRNADFYTMGCNLYIDGELALNDFKAFKKKTEYWNRVLSDTFGGDLYNIFNVLEGQMFDRPVAFLADHVPIGLPGFHIFKGHETAGWFFGNEHKDEQWIKLVQAPAFTEKFDAPKVSKHFSFTLVLKLPWRGGGLLIGDGLKTYYAYKEGAGYFHSGQFSHAIAPFPRPVLPTDERISLQAHGFYYEDKVYLYW